MGFRDASGKDGLAAGETAADRVCTAEEDELPPGVPHPGFPARLDLLPHPAAAAEEHYAGDGDGGLGDNDGKESAFRFKMQSD